MRPALSTQNGIEPFAQLQTAAMATELSRDVSHLQGSFAAKMVKGSRQWYFAYRENASSVRQIYVGPDTAAVKELIAKAGQQAPLDKLKPLAKSAQALGCAPIQRKHLSVILRLNEFGFFRAGGVLIGTHAFLAYANQLGVRWHSADQTSDIDFAHAGRNVSIALPADITAQPHSALTTMEGGFLPLVQYRGQAGASCKHRDEPEFQIDFLTPRTLRAKTRYASPTSTWPCSHCGSWSFHSKASSKPRCSTPPGAAWWSTCPRPSVTPCTSC
jgi:hypothetical protein